jgi:hypothetical protein
MVLHTSLVKLCSVALTTFIVEPSLTSQRRILRLLTGTLDTLPAIIVTCPVYLL